MSRSHTRSLFVDVAPGVWLGQFPYATPVRKLLQFTNEQHTAIDLATSKFVILGGCRRVTATRGEQWMSLNGRWSTLTGLELKEIYDQGIKDNSIREIRGVSRIAGTAQGSGSEKAVLVGLGSSKAGLALANKFFCNYSVANAVGRGDNRVTVEHGPSFMMSMDTVRLITGELVFPALERDSELNRGGGMDDDNPSFQQLVAYFDATGELLPRSTGIQFNSDLASKVVGLPQPRNNGYGNQPYRSNGYQQVQNWSQAQAQMRGANPMEDPDF